MCACAYACACVQRGACVMEQTPTSTLHVSACTSRCPRARQSGTHAHAGLVPVEEVWPYAAAHPTPMLHAWLQIPALLARTSWAWWLCASWRQVRPCTCVRASMRASPPKAPSHALRHTMMGVTACPVLWPRMICATAQLQHSSMGLNQVHGSAVRTSVSILIGVSFLFPPTIPHSRST